MIKTQKQEIMSRVISRFFCQCCPFRKEELKTVGVTFEYDEAIKFMGSHLMSLAAFSALTKSRHPYPPCPLVCLLPNVGKREWMKLKLNNFQFAGVAAECCCCHSKIVLSWETDALRFSKHLWRRRICFKEIVFSTRLEKMTTESDNVVVTELAPVATPTVAQVPAMPTVDAPKLKEDEHDIQVISAIDAWKHSDFLCRNYVMNDRKYKTEDVGAKKFVVGRFLDYKMVAKANFVEHGQSSKAKTNNNKGKGSKLGPKGGISKKPKFQGKCFNCGKQGHKSVDCRLPKKNKPKEANVIDDITKNVSDIDLTAVVSEVNLVGSNPKEWWIDTGATRHVCSDKKCSPLLNQLRMGKKCSWGTLPPLRSRVKVK
ncbi:hypothetical protein CK203_002413 [Vitis vinifera]|uniref:CCHC-type domain-containing protein n=1 Tax=Vitis vinifera TaxID=29760 RepID=A0A438KHX7_VITVI|nr:hypothetical protein CK203_002413 [Vitis vinifera]